MPQDWGDRDWVWLWVSFRGNPWRQKISSGASRLGCRLKIGVTGIDCGSGCRLVGTQGAWVSFRGNPGRQKMSSGASRLE